MTTSTKAFAVGDLVTVEGEKFPGVWRVVKRNPKTYALESVPGGTRLRAHVSYLHHAEAGDREVATAVPYIPVTFFTVGNLVRWSDPRGADILFVVVKDNGDKVNIVKVGGDKGRYWRVFRTNLTLVDPAEVLR